MDRLSALIILGSLAACDKAKPAPSDEAEPVGRANTAKVAVPKGPDVAAFCDVYPKVDAAKPLTLPDVTPPIPPGDGKWRWFNLWTTWCKPCVEEMPRIVEWKAKLAAAGHPVDVVFLNADASQTTVDAFLGAYPKLPKSSRVVDTEKLPDWFIGLGLGEQPPIPVHVFVDGKNRVRCARSSSVRETDYAVIEKLLKE